jgi:amino acid adenylation domain-containing protein
VGMVAGLERLAAMLGIWKAGGGYVPLDPGLPAERLAFMIGDTGMKVVLTEEHSAGRMPPVQREGEAGGGPGGRVTVVVLDQDERSGGPGEAGLPVSGPGGPGGRGGAGPANVAYVIYTSGSTGEPKGVVVEHRQVVNFLHGMVTTWQIVPEDVVLQFSSFTFDVSVLDTFAGLAAGARVVLADAETLHSPPRLAGLISEAGVSFAAIPPAVLSLLAGQQFPGLRVLITAGEELPSEVARAFVRPGLRFVNGYGPTEATVLATYAELDGTAYPPPIGLPTWPNYQVYVLDRYLNPVPAGVIGELHIGGAGVARGYLNQPELTAQRFTGDPFRPGLPGAPALGGPAPGALAGARLYKTGDLVRRRADGSIVFIGRIDGQVKIRGLRVELGEIETALTAHPQVAQAVVTVVTDPAGDRQLAAYLRPAGGAGGAEAAPAELRTYLADRLPDYMIPAYLVTVADFPLNASGKVDRNALPEPGPAAPEQHVAPVTMVETLVTAMFSRLLGREVGVTDSFFDVGGNSLRVMRLINMMVEELEVDVGVAEVFLAPSPRQLAALLRDKHGLQDGVFGSVVIEGLEELTGGGPATSMAGLE